MQQHGKVRVTQLGCSPAGVEHATPVAMYASSIAMQSLKSRKTKME